MSSRWLRRWLRLFFPSHGLLMYPFGVLARWSILCAILLSNAGSSAQSVYENSTADQYYWRQLHRRDRELRKDKERKHQELREQTRATLPELVADGASLQKQLIIATDGPSAFLPPKAPLLAGKRDYILLGLVLILVPTLVTSTVVRYKREAEIRLLAGNYLADGTEAARVKMPDFFEVPESPGSIALATMESTDGTALKITPSLPGAEFFAKAPERISVLRKLLSDFQKAFDDCERHQVLTKLLELVTALQDSSAIWELRPVWQMSSALRLLIDRLISKGKELTPSTLRTVASAVDVLGEVCVPGVRPDLIIHPPVSVLAVDDDPLCLRAVVFALEKAGLAPDVAGNGEKSVELADANAYDVIFMDIQMPGIDGLTATGKIRETKKNSDTPVIFVTVRSDFKTRVDSSRLGATDLIAKPFLQFEITVKALTFAMRKRLQLLASAQRSAAPMAPAEGHIKSVQAQTIQAVPV